VSSDFLGFSEVATADCRTSESDRNRARSFQTGTTDDPKRDRFFKTPEKRVFGSDASAPWLPLKVEDQLGALGREASVPNWDGERGLPVDASAWEDARALLRVLPPAILNGPDLYLSVSGDGTAHVTLYRGGQGRATVEVGRGRYLWTWVRGGDEDDVEELANLTAAKVRLAGFAKA